MKKVLAIILAVVMLIGVLPISALALKAPTTPGEIAAEKTATYDPATNKVTITLKVQGKDTTTQVPTGSKVVIVVDNSTSMKSSMGKCTSKEYVTDSHFWGNEYYCSFCGRYIKGYELNKFKTNGCGNNITSLTAAQNAAKKLTDEIYAANDANKVAIVSFGTDVVSDASCGLYASKYNNAYNAIANMGYSGGTNYTAALKQAMTYLGVSAKGDMDKLENTFVVFISDGEPGYSGESPDNPNWNGSTQARRLKEVGVEIYTIGMNVKNDKALTEISSDPDSTYHKNLKSTSSMFEDLAKLADTIGKKITSEVPARAGTKASLVDIINSDKFTLDSQSVSGLTFDYTNQKVTWDIGDITESVKSISFTVTPKDGVYGENIDTNSGATLTYTKPDGTKGSINVNNAKVDIPGYTVTYSWSVSPSGTAMPSGVTLPAGGTYGYKGTYSVDSTYSSSSVISTYDSYGNENGKYSFSGWKLDDKVVTGNQKMDKSDVTLTGVWTYEDVDVTEYTVSYKYTGTVPTDATELPANASYVKNQPVNVAAKATATGYDFSGWSTADATVAEDGSFKMPAKGVAFTGSFSAKKDVSYTVHYYKVDTTEKLANDKKVSNKTFNETYEEKAIGIDDYKLVSNEKQSIKLDAYDKEIIFYYEPNNPALEVTKTVDIEAPSVGDTVTYTIKVKNTGNISFKDLELADTMTGAAGTIDTSKLPEGVTYKDGKFTIASLAEKSKEVTFTYTYTVLESDAGKTISNKVVIPENINGEDVTVEIVVKNPGLNVTKTVDKSLASVGSTLNYKITVKNTGNVDFTNVTVADTFNGSGKLEYSKLPEGVTYDSQNNVFVIRQLNAGDEVVINLTYNVALTDSLTVKFLQNKAVVSAIDNNKEYTDESTSGKTTIIPLPVLDTDDHEAYIIGYSDGTVRPEKSITRAEVATIFFRLLEDDSRAAYWSQTNEFSDVNSGDWYNNAISTLANAGILTGYSDGTFKPNAPITRAEFAAIVSRFSEVVYNGGSSFTDVPSNHWAARYIALAEHLGWINGYTDGTFKPDKNINRAEAMTLINRVLEREVEQEHMLPNMMTWSDNTPDKWYYEAVQEATNSHTYTRTNVYVPNQTFQYEHWKTLLENPDWKALEQTWSDAN